MPVKKIILSLLAFIFLVSGCKRSPETKSPEINLEQPADTVQVDTVVEITSQAQEVKEDPQIIQMDTLWVHEYGIKSWYDSIQTDQYDAFFSVWVDTTDYLIDTVRSSKGGKIIIGYNHHYHIRFTRDKKYWFSLKFDKKQDLAHLLLDTDSWIESNLNIFDNLHYNEKYNQFVVELKIGTRDNISSLFYIVFSDAGEIEYMGTAQSWGGGSTDGESFLTPDGKLFVSCSEVFNFVTGSAMSLTEFASIAEYQSSTGKERKFIQTHGLRELTNNLFLVVFNRYHDKPAMNALVFRTDTTIIEEFAYYGFIEEMDAVLLYKHIREISKAFLLDTERNMIIELDVQQGLLTKEYRLDEMIVLDKHIVPKDSCFQLDFGFYVTEQFYFCAEDTVMYKTSMKDK
jgi:hypothetical protein